MSATLDAKEGEDRRQPSGPGSWEVQLKNLRLELKPNMLKSTQ